MTVRCANYNDIAGVLGILEVGFLLSHYGNSGLGEIDRTVAMRLLRQSVSRHGHASGGGTFFQVAETDNVIHGFILGVLDRVYHIGNRLYATDLFWLADVMVDPRDPEQLMRNMIDWAWSSPHVVEIKCGCTRTIAEDHRRAGNILRKLGMEEYGTIYRMERQA